MESPASPGGAFCYIRSMIPKKIKPRTERPGVGVGVVIFHSGHVLLGKRKGSHGAGEWALPGGKVDPNEHPCETAFREVKEETDIELDDKIVEIPFWSFDSYPGIDRDFITLYFASEWPLKVPQITEPKKCTKWEFFPWNNLPENVFCGLPELQKKHRLLCTTGYAENL